MNTTNGLRDHFAFLRERYQILLRRRAGQPPPWTDDPVLQTWRFTNVRREDDRTTIAFRETVRDPLRDDPHVLLATIAWRWFNLIETGEVLRPFLMSKDAWNRAEVERLLQARRDAGDNIFTGAYMVNSPQNEPKLPAILNAIDRYEKEPWTILLACLGAGALVAPAITLVILVALGRPATLPPAFAPGPQPDALVGIVSTLVLGVLLLGLVYGVRDEFDE